MKKGLTLIELIIVIVLFSVLMISVSWVFIVGLRTWNSGLNRAQIRQDSSLAMEKMVRELSQADSITDAAADEITFLADLDDDGINETVTFDVNNTELIRTFEGVPTVLAFDVQGFELSYRDLDDNLLNLPQDTASQKKRDDIRVIAISLSMNKADETIILNSGVYARNQ